MQAMIRASAIVLKKKQYLLPVMVPSHTLPSLELSLDSRYLHILGVSDPELYWCHYRDKKNHLKIRIPVQVFSFLLSFTSPLSPLKYNSVFMQRFHRRYSEKTWFGLQPYPWIQHQSALRCSFSIRKKKKNLFQHTAVIKLPFSWKLIELVVRGREGPLMKCGHFVRGNVISTSEIKGFEWCSSSLWALKTSFIP